jgi:hypothetical protein
MRKMPAFTKAPPETLERFAAMTSDIGALEHRTMFSYPSVFVNGNMLACVFQDRIMVRLSESDRAQFLVLPNTRLFEPMPGRPMREYVETPPANEMPLATLREWLARGVAYVSSLPVKARKTTTGKAKPRAAPAAPAKRAKATAKAKRDAPARGKKRPAKPPTKRR